MIFREKVPANLAGAALLHVEAEWKDEDARATAAASRGNDARKAIKKRGKSLSPAEMAGLEAEQRAAEQDSMNVRATADTLQRNIDTDRTGLECEEFIVMIGDAWDEKKATLKKDWLKAGSDTHNDAHGAAGAGPETSRRRKHKKRLVYQGGDRKDGDPPPPPPLPHAGGTRSPFSCDFMVLCAPEAPDAPLGPEEVG